jgi:hypothetical protein
VIPGVQGFHEAGNWCERGVDVSTGGGSMGLVGRSAALFLVTLDVLRDVLGEPMVRELVTIIALFGDGRAGSTLSSGASRLVVSLIGIRGEEEGHFGAFRLYLPSG